MPADADACVPREIASASFCSSNEEDSAAFGNRLFQPMVTGTYVYIDPGHVKTASSW